MIHEVAPDGGEIGLSHSDSAKGHTENRDQRGRDTREVGRFGSAKSQLRESRYPEDELPEEEKYGETTNVDVF